VRGHEGVFNRDAVGVAHGPAVLWVCDHRLAPGGPRRQLALCGMGSKCRSHRFVAGGGRLVRVSVHRDHAFRQHDHLFRGSLIPQQERGDPTNVSPSSSIAVPTTPSPLLASSKWLLPWLRWSAAS